jgi:hypothetical protein
MGISPTGFSALFISDYFPHQTHKLAALSRSVDRQSEPFALSAEVRENACRIFVKVNESRGLPVEDSQLSFMDAFQAAKFHEQRLNARQCGLPGMFHIYR